MRFPARPCARVAGMEVRFILHLKAFGSKGVAELFGDRVGEFHFNHLLLHIFSMRVARLFSAVKIVSTGRTHHNPSMSYSYRPRFGYDIRVRPPADGAAETPAWARAYTRLCDREGCERKAVVRAAKSPREATAKVWLCEAHAKAHNAQWNFFDGLSPAEAEAARLANVYGDRPTWKMSKNERARATSRARGPADLRDAFGIFSEAVKTSAFSRPAMRNGRPVSKLQEKAFETLELAVTAEAGDIRRRYAELLRRFHPDANGGDRSAETQLQEVVRAHHILKKAGFC